ncbi:putative transmembrane protein [Rhizoctonia solani 123E]|uniref:Putative transmembrane protein n=1 Tax=Rhizoctonia solani 123E TaxID=1423351 RepID=A0A074SPT6_9AGAM|nr:putative transmembrane protein [Rhizoctonia solani 123E]
MMMLAYLQSGPLKLGAVMIASWLSLFTLFIVFSSFLRGPEFEHAVSVIPHGVMEQRVVPVTALKKYPLSPMNRQVLDSAAFPYIPFMFDMTGQAPRINGASLTGAHRNYRNQSFDMPVSSKDTVPWSTFGVSSTDAVLLNEMVYDSQRLSWQLPKLTVYAWSVKSETTSHREVIYLSLKYTLAPQDAFMALIRTEDDWSVQFTHPLDASAPNKSLPFLRMLSLFLWPLMFHNFLGSTGLSGVFLIWVCIMTAGYAGLTIMVTHYLIHKDQEGTRKREGAAQRWEAEGWADMGVVPGDQGARRSEDDGLLSKADA